MKYIEIRTTTVYFFYLGSLAVFLMLASRMLTSRMYMLYRRSGPLDPGNDSLRMLHSCCRLSSSQADSSLLHKENENKLSFFSVIFVECYYSFILLPAKVL